jgi:hypothetical protein
MTDNDRMRRQIAAVVLGAVVAIGPCVGRLRADDAEATSSTGLAFVAAATGYSFDTGVLQGKLLDGGLSASLRPMRHVPSGTPVAGAVGLLSPYRLLTSDARFMPDGRDWRNQSRLLSTGAVEVHWMPDKEHPFDIKAEYRIAAPDTLDFSAAVTATRELRHFELFLSSYFFGFPQSFVYVQHLPSVGEKAGFMEAVKQGGVWQMFPRDERSVQIIGDGRWNHPPNPVAWKIMPRLAAPLALRRDPQSGLTAVMMGPKDECFAVSTPQGEDGHRSLYLSLFGRDLKAGETASAHGRLVIGKAISDGKAVELYQAYCNESRRPLP